MHMSDALLSPVLGGAFWAASAGLVALSARRSAGGAEESTVPLMGVLSAFVFAAQMINFTLPGTGSSGHLAGGLLLAIVLGAHRAFLAITSILVVQCLFFADGGLMALGANLFNLGCIPCYLVYPLVWKPLAARSAQGKILAATLLSTVLAFVLGALSIVVQTGLSGISDLPPSALALLLVPVQAALGVVEGLITAGILLFLRKARPDLLGQAAGSGSQRTTEAAEPPGSIAAAEALP